MAGVNFFLRAKSDLSTRTTKRGSLDTTVLSIRRQCSRISEEENYFFEIKIANREIDDDSEFGLTVDGEGEGVLGLDLGHVLLVAVGGLGLGLVLLGLGHR